MTPFPPIELVLKGLIENLMPTAEGKVGGDLSYDGTDDFYIWLGKVSGYSTQLEGEWTVDIDIFGRNYLDTMNRALALEPLLLAAPHRVAGLTVDSVFQNESPRDRPWDDESVYRISATYVLSARRSG